MFVLSCNAPVFDTTSPGAKGDCLKSGWLGRVMGISPLRGSLAAALLSAGREYPPAGVMAQSARHRLISGRMGPLGTLFCRHLHEATSCRWSWRILPRRSSLPGTCSGSDMIFSRDKPGGNITTPSLLIRIREGVAPNFFYLSIIFLSFLRTLTFRLWTVI